jgi:putative holliday junction resolvase
MSADAPLPTVTDALPASGALLGIDHGLKRIGIAISNSEQTIAVPVETWISKTPKLDAEHFRQLTADYRVQGCVVGLPLMNQTGDEGKQSGLARTFGEWLKAETNLPILYWDERYSSAQAETLLWSLGESPGKNKARLDGLAAQVILQSYLDRKS